MNNTDQELHVNTNDDHLHRGLSGHGYPRADMVPNLGHLDMLYKLSNWAR